MSYVLKYKLVFTDELDNNFELRILKLGYEGLVNELIGGAEPVVFKFDKQNDDRFECFKPTSVDLEIFVPIAGQYDEFRTIDNFQYKVEILKGADLYWSGWINDEVFVEEYKPGLYFVSLTATDGLVQLSGSRTELTTRQTHLQMVCEALAATGLELNVVDAIDVHETRHVVGGPLCQTRFDSDLFADDKGVRGL